MKNSRTKKLNAITIALATLTFTASLSTQATIIINEIDYDQPGTDTAEFIELFNTSPSNISLSGYFIDLVNGNNNTTYRSIDLTGFDILSGGYFVICNDTSLTANCNYDFTNSTGWLQNGSPDAVALFNGTTLIDSFSYEGIMPGFTEGSALTAADSNSEITSISRLPDGFDSNNNNSDFQLGCITPGTANISGIGDCSSPISSPVSSPISVAEPTTALLIGSGLIGLLGFTRFKQI